jgi:hypothetical protein
MLMYPIPDHAGLRRKPVCIARLIWQVDRIEAQ